MLGSKKELINWLLEQDEEKVFEIKEHKEKRSLNQNAFFWKLVNEIANVMKENKEKVHLDMLKHYGQSEVVSVLSNVDVSKYFKYYEIIGTGMVKDKEFNHIKIFKGSSEMDSKEMRILLEGTIQEAENLGIPTLTIEEAIKLKI